MSARHVLTILAVDDVPRAAAFYAGVFGWMRTVEAGVYVEMEVPGGMRFGVYERHAFAANTGCVPAAVGEGALVSAELYLAVDDLDGAVQRALSAGAALLSPAAARPWGDTVAYLRDPDGVVLALARA